MGKATLILLIQCNGNKHKCLSDFPCEKKRKRKKAAKAAYYDP